MAVLPIRWLRRIAIIAALALPWMFGWLWPLPSPQWDDWTVTAFAIDAILLIVTAIWWLWWRLPKWQLRALESQIQDPKARVDVEDDFRRTIGQALGGAAVLIGAGFAYVQFLAQQRATYDQLQSAHDLLISNQVAKGFEQLAGVEVAMRLGGIYGLEGVMDTSPQYHNPVLEALCAFVREGTISKAASETGPRTDIQAALTVIGRRQPASGFIDLAGVKIPRADLNFADLRNAVLIGADLRNARLSRATLMRAKLIDANLSGAHLLAAELNYAFLFNAHLNGALLMGADLRHAVLTGVDLSSADLSKASLIDVIDLNQAQLDKACGEDAELPSGLTLKPCPENKPAAPAFGEDLSDLSLRPPP
jgi:pentapeptide repeat protein